MNKNLIYIISTNRADFGLLKNLIVELRNNKKFKTKFIVSGNHLQNKISDSINEINNLKLKIDYKVTIKEYRHSKSRTELNLIKYINSFSIFFRKNRPNLLIILGDRFESLGICLSATYNNIPIAHISGGETTLGSHDEFHRHCISKLSLLHFVANSIYKKRVVQLGEHPNRVFNVGSLFLDSLSNLKFTPKIILQKKYKFSFDKRNILVTFHPVTNEPNSSKKYISEILNSFEKIKDVFFIFTYPNSDLGSQEIISKIKMFVKKNTKKSTLINSFGHKDYLSTLKYVDAVIGNSSSGLTEVPFFKIPTINLGDRQKGRYLEKTIINCEISERSIINNINKILKNSKQNINLKFKDNSKNSVSSKIIKILEKTNIEANYKKQFYDLKKKNKLLPVILS